MGSWAWRWQGDTQLFPRTEAIPGKEKALHRELCPKAPLLWAASVLLRLSLLICKVGGPSLLWLR